MKCNCSLCQAEEEYDRQQQRRMRRIYVDLVIAGLCLFAMGVIVGRVIVGVALP